MRFDFSGRTIPFDSGPVTVAQGEVEVTAMRDSNGDIEDWDILEGRFPLYFVDTDGNEHEYEWGTPNALRFCRTFDEELRALVEKEDG